MSVKTCFPWLLPQGTTLDSCGVEIRSLRCSVVPLCLVWYHLGWKRWYCHLRWTGRRYPLASHQRNASCMNLTCGSLLKTQFLSESSFLLTNLPQKRRRPQRLVGTACQPSVPQPHRSRKACTKNRSRFVPPLAMVRRRIEPCFHVPEAQHHAFLTFGFLFQGFLLKSDVGPPLFWRNMNNCYAKTSPFSFLSAFVRILLSMVQADAKQRCSPAPSFLPSP
jgi:hypothetical protein